VTKTHKKSSHDFELFLVQGIRAHNGPIWVAKFSPDGQFLATGGQDAVLKIWQVNRVQTQAKMNTDDPRIFAE
jgi:WD repeat-containing protein 44